MAPGTARSSRSESVGSSAMSEIFVRTHAYSTDGQNRRDHADQAAFDDQPPGRGAGAGSDCRMDGRGPASGGGRGQHHRAEVGGADDENEDRQRDEDARQGAGRIPLRAEQRRPRCERQRPPAPGIGVHRGQIYRRPLQPIVENGQRRPGEQEGAERSARRIRAPAGAEERVALGDRHPQVHTGAKKAGRRAGAGDASNDERASIDEERGAERLVGAGEQLTPEDLADHRDRCGASREVGSHQCPSAVHRHADEVRVADADELGQRLPPDSVHGDQRRLESDRRHRARHVDGRLDALQFERGEPRLLASGALHGDQTPDLSATHRAHRPFEERVAQRTGEGQGQQPDGQHRRRPGAGDGTSGERSPRHLQVAHQDAARPEQAARCVPDPRRRQ